jgi:RHS repeat-associated protein
VNTEGYYYRLYSATDGMFYDIDFRIVFKVGNPTSGPRTPLEHIQYNYSTNWLDQLESTEIITYDVSGNIDTVTTSQSFTYDNQGNPTEITNFVYNGVTYDYAILAWSGRELTNIYIMSSSGYPIYQIEYKYNDQGYRIQKEFSTYNGSGFTINQTIDYELIDDKVVYETDGTYGILYTYDYDGRLISFNYDSDINDSTLGIEYYYLHNQQGDITKIVDKDGNIVVEYYYDIWGNITKETDITGIDLANKNPYRYRGYRYDNDIDMYYLNSRYYNPEVGRFINADGLLGEMGDISSTNMFAYCANNPVMFIDSDGDCPILIWLIVAAYVAWGIQDICDIANGEISVEETESGINIVDSYKVQNPSVVIGYSIYLRYFSEHKESFDGSAAGIASEWIWHNVGYDVTVIPSKFGFLQDYNDRAASVDIGRTIFNESNWYVKYPSVVIETVLNPVAVIYDYFQYIHQSGGDGND